MKLVFLTLLAAALSLSTTTSLQAQSLKDMLKDAKQELQDDSDQKRPSTGSLSETDASSGLKEALALGVQSAISQLGTKDGFLGDAAVRIAAPKRYRKLVDTARKLGADKYITAFETSMNRAAEKAVPVAADIFADAVREMSVRDALNIVAGADDAATQYFRKVAGERLQGAFLPVVAKATSESGVTSNFKKLKKKTGGLGDLLSGSSDDVDLDQYVTDQAMDGLFYYVAEKEKAIRSNPLSQSSDLLRRVFGK